MIKIKELLVILFVAVKCSSTRAVDQIHTSEVKMTLVEFQELFSSARLAEAEQRLLVTKKRLEVEHQRKLDDLDKKKDLFTERMLKDQEKLFPENYQILSHKVNGLFNNSNSALSGVERDVCTFDIELTLRVMAPKWTKVPIINTTSTVASHWKVSWRSVSNDDISPELYQQLDPVTSSEMMLLLRSNQMVMVTNRTGLFHISFTAHSRVKKVRNLNSLGLSSLLYPISEVSLRLFGAGLIRELSVQPPAAVLRVDRMEDSQYTNIVAVLPPSDSIEIRWMDIVENTAVVDGTLPDVKENKTMTKEIHQKPIEASQVTVTHDVLHSIAEGIVKSTNILEFAASEISALNSVEFMVHGTGVRVASVVGHALLRWTVGTFNETTFMTPIQAVFRSSHLDSTATLHVYTELDLNETDDSVKYLQLPRIQCSNVLRQTGHIGIVKVANVEVHQHKVLGLSRAEASEISSQLRLNVAQPIVLSYKYLNPQHLLILRVKERLVMDTLEAVVDRFHYEAFITETHTMHSLLIILQSTKLQYLDLFGLPQNASMFTLIVNGVPAKPVEGGDSSYKNSISVPLLIGLDAEQANDGLGMSTSVELRFFSSHEPLGDEGNLTLSPPHIALPISVVTAELRLPKSNSYTFSGDFGQKSMDRLGYPVPTGFSYVKQKRVVPKNYKFSRQDDVISQDSTIKNKGAVKMTIPEIGRSFFFQRLLVVDTVLSLKVIYYPTPKPYIPTRWDSLVGYLFG